VSLASRAGDLYFTFRFVKLLTTPWEETDAFKLGIIDKDGKRVKGKRVESSQEKSAYTTFHRLAFNVKKLINALPGGSSKIASYAAAFFLLKEKFDVTEQGIEKICKKLDLDPLDFIAENSDWYLLEKNQLAPGIYRIKNDKLLSVSLEEVVRSKDKIRVSEDCFPVGEVFGLKVYEGIHINTQQKINFTVGEIYK